MLITQAHELINLINSEMFGATDITSNDYRGIIQLGQTVLSSNANKEKFLGLVDRIAETRLRTLDIELEFPNLLITSYEMSCVIQKINIQPFEAKPQNAWKVGDNDFKPSLYNIDKPVVSQKFFTDATAFEFDVTIPDKMLEGAFVSVEAFGAFIDGIMEALTDSMTIALNDLSYSAINNFIAEKVKAENGVINVLTGYNKQFGKSYKSIADGVKDKEFYRYVGYVMKNVIDYMRKPSKLYNIDGMVRATARDNMHVLVSSDFMNGFDMYLSADTFHNDLVNLKGFEKFTTLQATGTTIPDITNNTSINVIPASNASNDNTAVEVDGIIAVLADREAIGIGYNDRFSAEDRNNRDRYTNYTEGATLTYYNDLGENGVIIIAMAEGDGEG